VYTQFLFGGARESGVNFDSSGRPATGWVNRFAWAAGGGVQYRLTPSFSVRLGADYLRTSFFNSNLAIEGQSNLRTAASLVYTFGERRE
jgi:opacity protein-like surface antigen